MRDCIFCKIIEGEIEAKKIYGDEICLAFFDVSPATVGHTLIIPKKHYADFFEIDKETLFHMVTLAKDLGEKLKEKLNAKGMNILINSGKDAQQSLMHFHVHLIPRCKDISKLEFVIANEVSKKKILDDNKMK